MNIVIIAGTNRIGSMSKKIADKMLAQYQEKGVAAEVIDLSALPADVFVPTVYANKPESFTSIHQKILHASGLLFVVPEYNGSYPGILKYFIDLWEYPVAFEHRCVAFIGISAGPWGGLRAVEHVQGVFGYRNAWQFNERVFINNIYARWDGANIKKMHEKEPDIEALLQSQTRNFIEFCQVHTK